MVNTERTMRGPLVNLILQEQTEAQGEEKTFPGSHFQSAMFFPFAKLPFLFVPISSFYNLNVFFICLPEILVLPVIAFFSQLSVSTAEFDPGWEPGSHPIHYIGF